MLSCIYCKGKLRCHISIKFCLVYTPEEQASQGEIERKEREFGGISGVKSACNWPQKLILLSWGLCTRALSGNLN